MLIEGESALPRAAWTRGVSARRYGDTVTVSEPDRLSVSGSFVTVSTTVPVPADDPVVYPTKTATDAPGANVGRSTMLGAPTDATAPVREVLAIHPPMEARTVRRSRPQLRHQGAEMRHS
jgi:hypothetical protein